MRGWKLILLMIACLVGGLAIIAGFFYLAVRDMARRQDCERFNIDNIELRTATNIPDLAAEPICHYDPGLKIMSNYFRLDTTVDMPSYVLANKFGPVQDILPRFTLQQDWNRRLSKRNDRTTLYTKTGSYTGKESGKKDQWTYLLDTATRELWMEVVRTEPE